MFTKAFIGTPLKDSEFLKLEQTHLADIIAAEEGNEHFRSHEAVHYTYIVYISILDYLASIGSFTLVSNSATVC